MTQSEQGLNKTRRRLPPTPSHKSNIYSGETGINIKVHRRRLPATPIGRSDIFGSQESSIGQPDISGMSTPGQGNSTVFPAEHAGTCWKENNGKPPWVDVDSGNDKDNNGLDNASDCGIQLENGDTGEEVIVCSLSSKSMYTVPVLIQDCKIRATIDTTAEVTVISDSLYQRVLEKPTVINTLTLQTAGRQLQMKALVVGPVALQLGTSEYSIHVYVAPLGEDMLLGLDFLRSNGVQVLMDSNQLKLGTETIDMVYGKETREPTISKVCNISREVILPNTVVRLPCIMSTVLSDFMLEPVDGLEVMIPRSVHNGGDSPVVCVMNPTDHSIILDPGRKLANAVEVFVLPKIHFAGSLRGSF